MKMKKLVILIVTALLAVPGFAQIEPVYTSSDGKAMFDIVHHIGYGYNITKSSDFKPGWCSDFFLNILSFGLYPTEHLGFEPAGQRLQHQGQGVRPARRPHQGR